MSSLSTQLEQLNRGIASDIGSGKLSGSRLDSRIVSMEQTAVQAALDKLNAANPEQYKSLVSEANNLLNPKGALGVLGKLAPTDRAYNRVLDGVRKDLGRDIDFSKQSDREAIGNAVIDHIRRTGGCDVTGSRIKSC